MKFFRDADARTAGDPLPSRIPANALLEGSLAIAGDVLISGRIGGDVEAAGTVTVAAGGEVEGTVHARIVVVAGRVSGPVVADERIEVRPGGSVSGDLTSPHVVIADGADLHGKVDVLR